MTRRSPMVVFLLANVILVSALVGVSAAVATRFFQDAILERESQLINDLVTSLLADHEPLASPLAPALLDRQLQHLLALDGILRLNIFDPDQRLMWSSEADSLGRPARRGTQLAASLEGDVVPILDPFGSDSPPDWSDAEQVMEFYVPIRLGEEDAPIAAMGVYRDASKVKATLDRGEHLIRLSAGAIGMLLIFTATGLHALLLRRHRATLASLGSLSAEHRRIVQLEKMSALGRMVGDIAHQVNSPLVGVVNRAQLAQRHLNDPVRMAGYLADIESAGKHCADFVRRLLDLSRVSRFATETVALERVVREAVQLIRQGSRDAAPIELTLPATTVLIDADPVLLRHAIFNLLRNAQAASPLAGHIQVRLSECDDGWTVEVEDQGPGIPSSDRERIFQPFFTTRPDGNGLGLAVADTVATLHDGRLEALDGATGGALFQLTLPRSGYTAEESPHARPSAHSG